MKWTFCAVALLELCCTVVRASDSGEQNAERYQFMASVEERLYALTWPETTASGQYVFNLIRVRDDLSEGPIVASLELPCEFSGAGFQLLGTDTSLFALSRQPKFTGLRRCSPQGRIWATSGETELVVIADIDSNVLNNWYALDWKGRLVRIQFMEMLSWKDRLSRWTRSIYSTSGMLREDTFVVALFPDTNRTPIGSSEPEGIVWSGPGFVDTRL